MKTSLTVAQTRGQSPVGLDSGVRHPPCAVAMPSLNMGAPSGLELMPGMEFSSVTQLCPTLCDPVDNSMPGFPVHHQLPELTQTQVHQVGDAIQPSHPLSFPFPSAFHSFPPSESFPMSQFFTSGGQSIGASTSASVLPMNI